MATTIELGFAHAFTVTALSSFLAAQCGNNWSALGNGLVTGVRAAVCLPNGAIVAGGVFSGGPSYVAQWNGATWSGMGTGMDWNVYALIRLANGDVVAGGQFGVAGGVSVHRVARWNGTTWTSLGFGPTSLNWVDALAELPNGDIVAGGSQGSFFEHIVRWNGSSWGLLGGPGSSTSNSWVRALAVAPTGDLLAGGSFTTIGGLTANGIARWNGTTWSPLGSGVVVDLFNPVLAIACMANGDVVVGGSFSTAGGLAASNVARWDGASWHALGAGTNGAVRSLRPLPNGDLLAGGDFTLAGGVATTFVARWNGSTWSPVDGGLNASVHALASAATGEIVAGGFFSTAGAAQASRIARLSTTCPATVAGSGAGCSSSGGPNSLQAASLPWVGGRFQATASGLPALALVAIPIGFNAIGSVPLTSLPLPMPQAGCFLHVAPDILDATITTSGLVAWDVVLPNVVSLAGNSLHLQMVPLELNTAASIVATTATNALTLTIGAF